MMDSKEYYIAPSNEIFNEIKRASIELWNTYDNEFGYVDEKVDRIEHIKNIADNTCYMVAMFDSMNQHKLLKLTKEPAKTWLQELIDWHLDESIKEIT